MVANFCCEIVVVIIIQLNIDDWCWHALIVLAVIVLIFGAARLPALARSVGQSMRILKSEVADREVAPKFGDGPLLPCLGQLTVGGRCAPLRPVDGFPLAHLLDECVDGTLGEKVGTAARVGDTESVVP